MKPRRLAGRELPSNRDSGDRGPWAMSEPTGLAEHLHDRPEGER